ncbi:MAG TPA: hypothetical protein VNS32_18050, partial [Flavisolibacter sp.]|nr:hypothetical protein [Flavisolibacter sp.]
MKAILTIITLVLTTPLLRAQDLNGFWKGTLSMSGGCFAVNNVELQLHIRGTTVFGDSYHYENVNYYVKKKISGVYDSTTKKLTLHEDYVTTFHIPQTCKICIKNFYLFYTRDG